MKQAGGTGILPVCHRLEACGTSDTCMSLMSGTGILSVNTGRDACATKKGDTFIKNILSLLIAGLLIFPAFSHAETKEIIAEGTYNMGDGETPTVAESRALLQAKRTAVEEAGTYVESYSKTRNFQLTVDEIQVLASGVMEVEVLEKKRTIVGDGFNFWIKIKARVSTDRMQEMAKRLKERTYFEDYKKIQEAYDTSQKEIEELKRQLAGAKGEQNRKQVETKIAVEEKRFQTEAWIEKGYQANLYKDTDEAIKGYTNALVLEPDNYDAIVGLGNVYYDTGQPEKAIEFYRKALRIKPNDVNVLSDIGVMYRNSGKIDKSIEMFKKAVSIDPKHEQAIYNLGVVLYMDKKDMEGAADTWEQLLKTNPSHSFAKELKQNIQQIYYVAANTNYSKGQYDKAIEGYSKAIAIEPNDANAYNNRGLVYVRKGQYDKAVEDYNRAIALNPNDAEAYIGRGNAYDNKGQYDRAIKDFNKAIALDPNNAPSYYNRGNAYYKKGQYDRAIEDYNKAIALDPNLAQAYTARGAVYYSKEQYDRAIEDYNKAIALDPNLVKIYSIRGAAYLLVGNYKLAINDLTKAIQLNTEDVHAYSYRGLAYARSGNNQQAVKDLNKAIELNPEDDGGYYNMSCFYSLQKQADKACHYLEKSIEKGYKNWDWIEKDKDFDNIRNAECYKRIMKGK